MGNRRLARGEIPTRGDGGGVDVNVDDDDDDDDGRQAGAGTQWTLDLRSYMPAKDSGSM